MTAWKCTIHNIKITEDAKRREVETAQGSIRGMPPCRLLTMFQIKEGKFGECELVKEA
jgi:hypothetical protein